MSDHSRQKSRITFRALASVYLIYLAYSMIRDWNGLPENGRIGFALAIAAFIIIPAFFLYTCWRDWKVIAAEEKAEQEQLNAPVETAQDDTVKALEAEEAEYTDDERARLELAEKLASEGRVEELEELLGTPEEGEKQ